MFRRQSLSVVRPSSISRLSLCAPYSLHELSSAFWTMRFSTASLCWAQNIHRGTNVVLKQQAGPNREALQLYRDILRTCRGFYWNDVDGTNWGEKLAKSARDEFEQARFERDPLLVARMLVVGREALMNVQNKAAHANSALVNNVDNTRTDRAGSVGADHILRAGANHSTR